MTVELIALALGIYFIGISISITQTKGSIAYVRTIDLFKLLFGVVLFLVAIYKGVNL